MTEEQEKMLEVVGNLVDTGVFNAAEDLRKTLEEASADSSEVSEKDQ